MLFRAAAAADESAGVRRRSVVVASMMIFSSLLWAFKMKVVIGCCSFGIVFKSMLSMMMTR